MTYSEMFWCQRHGCEKIEWNPGQLICPLCDEEAAMTVEILTDDQRYLWEILVPTTQDGKHISKQHHKKWDEEVRKISGGLTILSPAVGQWINPQDELLEERMLPVRLIASESQMEAIAELTLMHYNQHSVMYYVLSKHFKIKARHDVNRPD